MMPQDQEPCTNADSSGTEVARWGGYGSGIGQFDHPFGVAVAPNGDVFVADSENHRVHKYGPALRSFRAELLKTTAPLLGSAR